VSRLDSTVSTANKETISQEGRRKRRKEAQLNRAFRKGVSLVLWIWLEKYEGLELKTISKRYEGVELILDLSAEP